MRVAWIKLSAAALVAAPAALFCAPLEAADESGFHYVAEELGSRTKTAQATTGATKGGLSDSAVRVMSTYALSVLPDEYPSASGEMVKLDKSDPNKFLIPIDNARGVIKVATRSAYAEVCNLPQLEKANFDTMILSEQARTPAWSREQMMFIHALHTFATSYFAGNATITTAPADGSAAANAGDGTTTTITPKKLECAPGQAEKVTAAINAYVQSASAQPQAPQAGAATGAN